MPDAYLQIRWNDALDVTLVAVLLWMAMVWLRRSRARLAFVGLLILGAVFLAARQLDLQLTVWILQGFFAVLVIILVIVFQEDLRRLFEHIALLGLGRRGDVQPARAADVVARTVARWAAQRTGALLVFPGRTPLDRHLEGGIAIDAVVSEPLLMSIFDTSSPGHDGALVFAGERIARFAVHLPLSTDHAHALGGTRHAAALGLAERSDALTVVVSEERGTVSIARDGRIRQLESPKALAAELRDFMAESTPAEKAGVHLRRSLVGWWKEGLAAVALAVILWALLIHGSGVVEVVRQAEVMVENLPAGYVLEGVEPPTVEVTLQGPRRLFYLAEPEAPEVKIDALLVELGRVTYEIRPEQVEAPGGLEVVSTNPTRIRLSVRR